MSGHIPGAHLAHMHSPHALELARLEVAKLEAQVLLAKLEHQGLSPHAQTTAARRRKGSGSGNGSGHLGTTKSKQAADEAVFGSMLDTMLGLGLGLGIEPQVPPVGGARLAKTLAIEGTASAAEFRSGTQERAQYGGRKKSAFW